ncbi:MAG: transcriptional regulator, MerR family [Eubacterium sp.]|jgi:DNA-binding transcriptional MerR regulator|nr:transcriptional regulator, MerR family [Eubacterium sp.]
MNTYKTTEVAKIIGIHSNTVRLYEELGLISKPWRKSNGYRIFTDIHIEQFKLARLALRTVLTQNGLRKKAMAIIKLSAAGLYEKAISLTQNYIAQIASEQKNAEEAINIARQIINKKKSEITEAGLTRKEAADYLKITIDTLRTWELNGLLTVKRKKNGYRIYDQQDIQRLKIIRSLRCANYSLSSILRMLNCLTSNEEIDIREIINTPQENEDIIYACDMLLTSLHNLHIDAVEMLAQLKKLEQMAALMPPSQCPSRKS